MGVVVEEEEVCFLLPFPPRPPTLPELNTFEDLRRRKENLPRPSLHLSPFYVSHPVSSFPTTFARRLPSFPATTLCAA